jgi:epoxyqueuosine reductase
LIEQPVDNNIFEYIFERYEVKIAIEDEAKKYKQKIYTEQYGFEDGAIGKRKEELDDPKKNTLYIKDLAKELGADMVGVSKVKKEYFYKGRELDHEFAISLAKEMDYDKIQESPEPSSATEVIRVYCVLGKITIKMASKIRELGYPAYAHHPRATDKFPALILHIPCAIEAGFGELGRHGLLITKKYGPRVRLSTITTDLPLAPDASVSFGVKEFCENCFICTKECEGNAVPEQKSQTRGVNKYTVDPYKCAPYFGEYDGCSVCIKVCPFNKKSE